MAGNRRSGRRPGFKHTVQTRFFISRSQSGKRKREEHSRKISAALRGVPKPPEVREKISRAMVTRTPVDDLLYDYHGTPAEKWILDNYDQLMCTLASGVLTNRQLRAVNIIEGVRVTDFGRYFADVCSGFGGRVPVFSEYFLSSRHKDG